MGHTFTVDIDNDSTLDANTVPVDCTEVILWSKDGDAIGGYYLAAPLISSTQVLLSEGEKARISAGEGRKFYAGQVVGYMKAVNGTTWTMQGVAN